MDRIYDDPADIDRQLLDRVIAEYFEGQPVRVSVDVEGQRLTEDGLYLLGCRAGPSVEVENLLHEMAHLAEREKEKLLEFSPYNWGYSYGQYWEVAGRSGHEARTDQSVRREGRIWAYQLNLIRYFGTPKTARELVGSAVYMEAFYIYKNRVLRGFEQFDYKEKENKALDIFAEEVEQLADTEFTLDAFNTNWHERMELLRNETKSK